MSVKIESVEAVPLRYSLGGEGYGSSRGIVPARETTLVRVVTTDGAVGWGESFGPTSALVPLVKEVSAALPGARLDGPVPFSSAALQQHYHRGGGLHAAAVSGVEIALWDALGHTLGVSVATLLGGRAREHVTPYASGGYVRADRDLGKFTDHLQRECEGMTGLKIKCGLGLREDRARAEAARRVLGPDKALMIDFNGNYAADQARASILSLEDLNLAWVEEPLAPDDISGLRLLRSLDVSLATGEALYTRAPFRSLITERLVDVVQPDLAKIGGLAEAKVVCELARTWGIRVSPHVWGSGVALAANLQLLGSLPDYPHTSVVPEPLWLEFDRGENDLRERLLAEPFKAMDGVIAIPDSPGLGITVDEAFLETLREDR